MLKGNDRDTRTTSMMPLLLTLNRFVNPFSVFSITDFEEVNSVDRNTNRRNNRKRCEICLKLR